jgi:hypothetical protein
MHYLQRKLNSYTICNIFFRNLALRYLANICHFISVSAGAFHVKRESSFVCRFLLGSGPAAAAAPAGTRHLYRLSLENNSNNHGGGLPQSAENGSDGSRLLTCLTCGSGCDQSDIYLSKDNSHYLLHCLGPQVPFQQVSNQSMNFPCVLGF